MRKWQAHASKIPILCNGFSAFIDENKANVIPEDEKRISIATKFKACLQLEGFQFEFFADFEAAIEWLSDTTQLGQNVT